MIAWVAVNQSFNTHEHACTPRDIFEPVDPSTIFFGPLDAHRSTVAHGLHASQPQARPQHQKHRRGFTATVWSTPPGKPGSGHLATLRRGSWGNQILAAVHGNAFAKCYVRSLRTPVAFGLRGVWYSIAGHGSQALPAAFEIEVAGQSTH